MVFDKKTNHFLIKHSVSLLIILMGYISYFIFESPVLWDHQDTLGRRWMGYHITPYVVAGFIILPVYEWFKYKAFEIQFCTQLIKFNGKVIDISSVNEINRTYVSVSDSYKYSFYQIEFGMAKELVTIPMFFTPRSKVVFEQKLSDFCSENKVKLVTLTNTAR